MARCLAWAALTASAGAVMVREQVNRTEDDRASCEQTDLAMAKLTTRTCQINWALDEGRNPGLWKETVKVGCWNLIAYNTDMFFSSTVYQRETDGRCALVFSGYHGMLAGYARAVLSLSSPPILWPTCGYNMWAPYVRLFRHHTSLANWSTMMHTIAGPSTTCKSDLVFSAESMGGSSGEMLAACANAGRLNELMDPGTPSFKLEELYTFGSPAATTVAISNKLRNDGCFRGKRIFFAGDLIGRLGQLGHLAHARMDAVEIWPSEKDKRGKYTKPSVLGFTCKSKETVMDVDRRKPPPPKVKEEFTGEVDPVQHSVTSYEADMQWFHDVGLGELFFSEPNTQNPSFLEHYDKASREELMQTSARYVSEYANLWKKA